MKKQCSRFSRLAVFVVTLLLFGSRAYADDTSQFNHFIQLIHTHRAQMEAQLGLDPQADPYPQATSYYDDKEAHYEQVLIMSDFIDKGIR
jgi:hypothetical protein